MNHRTWVSCKMESCSGRREQNQFYLTSNWPWLGIHARSSCSNEKEGLGHGPQNPWSAREPRAGLTRLLDHSPSPPLCSAGWGHGAADQLGLQPRQSCFPLRAQVFLPAPGQQGLCQHYLTWVQLQVTYWLICLHGSVCRWHSVPGCSLSSDCCGQSLEFLCCCKAHFEVFSAAMKCM